jgi:hypothetical protein
MPNKPTPSQIAERIIYILTVIFAPSIPLFFLYSKNAAQGLLFRHFLIMGGALAVISLILYIPISKLFLRRRRTMIIIALFWSAFWFFKPLGKIIARGNAEFSQVKIVVYLLILIAIIGFIFRYISMNRLVANTIAGLLCLMFVYNFIPSALRIYIGERQRANNEKTGILPYRIKTKFNVDHKLPHPNIYWLHMDGMVGFDMVECYFNDPQTELEKYLVERGFVINKNARLEAGSTNLAIPAMISPVFYDSYLATEFTRVAKLTRKYREDSIYDNINKNGFSLNDDIYQKNEILKAFSDTGYINIANTTHLSQSGNMNIWIDKDGVTTRFNIIRQARNTFNILFELSELITAASVLSIVKPKIDKIFENKRPIANPKPLPEYQEIEDKYIKEYSDSNINMAYVVRAMKYVTSIETPHFVYFDNLTAHVEIFDTAVGKVTYEEPVGLIFYLDEYGNLYKERLDDPLDIHLYLPQHKYAVKQMIAQVDTILENDPDALIILQADHGIHAYGKKNYPYDFEEMSARGYSLEDQLNLNFSVMSAVRIPSQYGKLSQPLDPLDITRYLVNNFVGKGNYDYLYYKEESTK